MNSHLVQKRTLMTRQETVDYHRAQLAQLEQDGCDDEDLLQYHRDGTQIFLEPEPFNPEVAARLAQTIAKMSGKPPKSLEEMERIHNEFYANEKLLK